MNTPTHLNPFASERAQAFEVIRAESEHPEKVTKTACLELFRAVKRSHRFAERRCSDESWSDKDERADDRLDEHINAIAARLGVRVTIGGDPRGHVVHLMTPKTGRYNTFGGADVGWGLRV